jgi:hypothetical protein
MGCVSGNQYETENSAQHPLSQQEPTKSRNSQAKSKGSILASELTRRYNDTRENCGSDSLPNFKCTGIILRGTGAGVGYNTWDPSETAERVGGVSFSFLRSDSKITRLANGYSHGFIFYPDVNLPLGTLNIEALCFFPIDGASDNRTERGCGAHKNYPNTSMPCERQNIKTGEQWRDHYRLYGGVGKWGGCGFGVANNAGNSAAPNFYEGMRGGTLAYPAGGSMPNDLKYMIWAQNIPEILPIEAFFYLKENAAGLELAKNDQRKFFELTEIVIPIISMTLPSTPESDAKFEYIQSDQAILPPTRDTPAPVINGVTDSELDFEKIKTGAVIRVGNWPDIANNQAVWLRLEGTKTDGQPYNATLWQPPSSTNPSWVSNGYYTRTVSYENLKNLKDGSVLRITFKAVIGNSKDERAAADFPIRNYIVRTLPAPKLKEAYGENGDHLKIDDIYTSDFVTVEIPEYTNMAVGNTVRARWAGRVTYDLPVTPITTIGPLLLQVPRREVIDSIGSTVKLNYTVRRVQPDGLIESSKVLNLKVDPQVINLPAPQISNDKTQVTVHYPDLLTGHLVRVRLSGVIDRDTANQPAQTGQNLTFQIPPLWITENSGKMVYINYSLTRNISGEKRLFSRILRVQL